MLFLLISPKNRTVYNFRGDLIRAIRAKGYDVIVTGPDRQDVDRILSLGVRFIPASLEKNGMNVLQDVFYCAKLFKIMRAEKPDAVLGYTAKPVIYGSLAAALAGVENINSMVTGGGYTFTSTSLKARVLGVIVRMLYRFSLRRSKHVIFQNPDDLKQFADLHLVKPEKCAVVNGSGVNMEHFLPRETEEHEGVHFFMLSRLLKSKGVQEYLRAAELVKARYPAAEFALLGKYETNMQDAVSADEVEGYIRRGIIRRYEETDDVRPYYADCDVFVLPSYREGTPRSVLEAMAMGKAVITTDTNGCRETVEDGRNGFLVPVKDVPALAEAMMRLMENPALAEQMGRESLALCREKYDVNKVNRDMLSIMEL